MLRSQIVKGPVVYVMEILERTENEGYQYK